MCVHWDVDHHLVIHELIGFGGLYNPVECHDATKPWILKDNEVLVVCGGFEQGLSSLEALAPLWIQGFLVAHQRILPRRSSTTSEREGRK